MNFSVLISVYIKDDPTYLEAALKSIWQDQTLKPNEIVIVKDGTLTKEINEIIFNFSKTAPVEIVILEKNMGLGLALREGVVNCTFDLIARMDSDDISFPDRFDKQIAFLKKNPSIDVIGSYIEEFFSNKNSPLTERHVPEKNEEIVKAHKIKNAINHVTIIAKKSKILNSGNYESMLFFEDYYLWARMMLNDCEFYNLQEPLVSVRVGNDMIDRRKGSFYAKCEIRFYKSLMKIEFISFFEFLKAIVLRIPLRFLPNKVLFFIYKNVVRK